MSGLFEDINLFDHEIRTASRKASAVAFKRVEDRVGGYLRLAKTTEERQGRLDFVSDDIRQICADVAEEYGTDADRLVDAIEEHLKGDGVTDLDDDLEDAPTAVGVGRQAAGHKDGCECGFCKNKGNIHKKDDDSEDDVPSKVEGVVDQEEKDRKDASEPEWRENIKDSAIREALTAKDFVMLADAISKAPGTSPELAGHFADYLAGTNPRFDRERFIAAATGNPLNGRDQFNPSPTPGVPSGVEAQERDEADTAQMMRNRPLASVQHEADADRDGGGAVKREKLPKGDGKAVGTEPSPKIDHRKWRPNALNPSTNTPPVDTEMSGTPNPTVQQDVEDVRDYERDFTEETDAVTEHQDLPSAGPDGFSTERNISQDGQDGTWTEAQADPVTSPTLSSFIPDNQVESALQAFKDKE